MPEGVPEIAERIGSGIDLSTLALSGDSPPAVDTGACQDVEARSLEGEHLLTPSEERRHDGGCDQLGSLAEQSRLRHERLNRLQPVVLPMLTVISDRW